MKICVGSPRKLLSLCCFLTWLNSLQPAVATCRPFLAHTRALGPVSLGPLGVKKKKLHEQPALKNWAFSDTLTKFPCPGAIRSLDRCPRALSHHGGPWLSRGCLSQVPRPVSCTWPALGKSMAIQGLPGPRHVHREPTCLRPPSGAPRCYSRKGSTKSSNPVIKRKKNLQRPTGITGYVGESEMGERPISPTSERPPTPPRAILL